MNKINSIGLDTGHTKEMADKLNVLLANYTMFYMNVRGFHWNIRGNQFFELHKKFEDLYNDLAEKIDEVAERILTLGHTPVHTFSDYLRIATIKEVHDVTGATETVTRVLDVLSEIISQQRELLQLSGEANDEGTNAMMSDYIREQEKLVWMFSAFMGTSVGNNRPGTEGKVTGAA